jgi:hypothetical protein
MDPKHEQNLKPADMVSLVKSHGRAGFSRAVGAPLLLVRLDDPSGDLALMLEAALEAAPTTDGWRPEVTMGYETVIGSVKNMVKTSSLTAEKTRTAFTPAELHQMLLRAPHFAVALQKRKGAANIFSDKITVGRARTNDVVLRHFSVSKFQAWFKCDDEDRFYVCDAKSTNPTFLNGAQVSRTSPVAVTAGDTLRFGDVVTVFSTAELLWDALAPGGHLPPSSRSPRR